MHTLKDVEKAYSYYRQPIFSFKLLNLRKKAINKLNLNQGYKVLDIACGTGSNFKYIEKLIGKKGKIIAIDYTKEMLESRKNFIISFYHYVNDSEGLGVKTWKEWTKLNNSL